MPTPEDLLNDNAYTLLAHLDHDDIMAFVVEYQRKFTALIIGYNVLVALCVLALIIQWIGRPFGEGLSLFGWGLILGFLIIIPHEHLHALAYRMIGADDVRIIYNWRRLQAFCAAHNVVVNGREFVLVALLPFVVITPLLLVMMALLPEYALIITGILLFHTAACSGDFALLNFVWIHRDQTIYSFDDLDRHETVFVKQNPS